MNSTHIRQLKHDLLWCIGSPELLENKLTLSEEINSFFANGFSITDFSKQLALAIEEKLEKEPDYLLSQVASLKTRRLGERFELFCQIAFELHPDFELLAHNLQIKDASKTLGELDLVINHRSTEQTYHLELACKFYLQLTKQKQCYWIGPGLRDRLDTKLKRMVTHQLKISERAECQTKLNERGWLPIISTSLIKGRLFYELSDDNLHGLEYAWGTAAQILNHFEHFNWQWQRLGKDEWLAPLQCLTREETLYKILSRTIEKPIQLVAFEREQEVKRLFWVPDNWRDKALEALEH